MRLKKYPNKSTLDHALARDGCAIELEPDLAEAHFNRGSELHQQQRLDEALENYACAIRLRPAYAQAYFAMGNAFKDQKRITEALAAYEVTLQLQPDHAMSWCSRGIVLSYLRRFDEAIASYRHAVDILPSYSNAYLNMGSAFKALGRIDEAVALYDQTIAVNPELAEAYASRGSALHGMARFDDALSDYQRALELNPSYPYLLGILIHLRHRLCDWSEFDADHRRLANALESRAKIAPPFIVATVCDEPHHQRLAAEVWSRSMYPLQDALGPIAALPKKDRIRLGYYSADFHHHATCRLMAQLFELHDKDRFEVFALSFGPDTQDEMRQRIVAAFDQFIDVRGMSDREVAHLSRELEIDIAIDLKGHTQDARPGIFSYRCAPIQVSYLGYPGTLGADYMDYLVADKIVIPPDSQIHYGEKIAYLPHSYQVNDTKRKISAQAGTRESMGLPAQGFVFCCFNNTFKITPHTFDRWMRILHAVDGSVLWLLADNPSAIRNLQHEAQVRGVDPGRLIFGSRLPQSEHLARHRHADLFLDTLPCNAHTTTSDALWAGLPVLTLPGASFAARVSASLLHAIGVPELVAHSPAHYEATAIELATQPERLLALREKIATNRASTPLYDTVSFTRHLEQAYVQMHTRRLEGASPAHLRIDAAKK